MEVHWPPAQKQKSPFGKYLPERRFRPMNVRAIAVIRREQPISPPLRIWLWRLTEVTTICESLTCVRGRSFGPPNHGQCPSRRWPFRRTEKPSLAQADTNCPTFACGTLPPVTRRDVWRDIQPGRVHSCSGRTAKSWPRAVPTRRSGYGTSPAKSAWMYCEDRGRKFGGWCCFRTGKPWSAAPRTDRSAFGTPPSHTLGRHLSPCPSPSSCGDSRQTVNPFWLSIRTESFRGGAAQISSSKNRY